MAIKKHNFNLEKQAHAAMRRFVRRHRTLGKNMLNETLIKEGYFLGYAAGRSDERVFHVGVLKMVAKGSRRRDQLARELNACRASCKMFLDAYMRDVGRFPPECVGS
jgi:hypothetical protein